ERYLDRHELVATADLETQDHAGPGLGHHLLEGGNAHDRLAIDIDDQVIRAQARFRRRGIGKHIFDIGWCALDDVGHQHDTVEAAWPLGGLLTWRRLVFALHAFDHEVGQAQGHRLVTLAHPNLRRNRHGVVDPGVGEAVLEFLADYPNQFTL